MSSGGGGEADRQRRTGLELLELHLHLRCPMLFSSELLLDVTPDRPIRRSKEKVRPSSCQVNTGTWVASKRWNKFSPPPRFTSFVGSPSVYLRPLPLRRSIARFCAPPPLPLLPFVLLPRRGPFPPHLLSPSSPKQ